ncbi:hypothetical protein F441_22161 [Phytophthora nicotianae CJ01A1]|uniref:Uncharacterized protein n=3 Tax=Phytophthora nicotianae TaxID=4792 RepID=W2PYV1_PHYN3|nr:hypothetical protein PPTG_13877 [Phytophthora nicotianae INRA-310]ETN06072.1 hypothetical protein PPTG_13877 [Phytophthora nicotianae INRA-310]ETP00422.1 hypothetical protein F441_22161 [Phytophthora nicotianae CJ01A1]ETP40260.1 hypothetical protein F442_12370 [Phytophthora nicotianae P10297]
MEYCSWCRCEPCDRERFGPRLLADRGSMHKLNPKAEDAALDKAVYHIYYYRKHGYFEQNPRYVFPRCVSRFLGGDSNVDSDGNASPVSSSRDISVDDENRHAPPAGSQGGPTVVENAEDIQVSTRSKRGSTVLERSTDTQVITRRKRRSVAVEAETEKPVRTGRVAKKQRSSKRSVDNTAEKKARNEPLAVSSADEIRPHHQSRSNLRGKRKLARKRSQTTHQSPGNGLRSCGQADDSLNQQSHPSESTNPIAHSNNTP